MGITIKFKKIRPEAQLPTKAHSTDAAWDLYTTSAFYLRPGKAIKVPTGLQLADMPAEDGNDILFLQIEGRSGIASKTCFPVGGIIDASYRGEIMVILYNGSDAWDYHQGVENGIGFKSGDRIAQLVLRRTPKCEMIETEESTLTDRGANGFGSTGS
jgi:dUTP pyrophosphatase